MKFSKRFQSILTSIGFLVVIIEFLLNKFGNKTILKTNICNVPSLKTPALQHEFSSMVSLFITIENDTGLTGYKYQARCGGSLIRKNWILTAAHCLKSESIFEIDVVAGVNNLSALSSTQQTRKDKTFVIHEDFYHDIDEGGTKVENDVALIELDYDFELNEFVSLIPIGETGIDSFSQFVHCQIAGWGTITPCEDFSSDILMKAEAFILRMSDSVIVTNDVARRGDSGGPLLCKNWISLFNSRYHLYGITSTGVPGRFSKFMRVSNHNQWIEATILSDKPRRTTLSHQRWFSNMAKEGILFGLSVILTVVQCSRCLAF